MAPTTTVAPTPSSKINLKISNNNLTLYNIVSIDNDAIYDILEEKKCLFSSQCGDGKCILGKCYNVAKNLYELNGTTSYLQLEDVDNLNTHFKFVLLFTNTNEFVNNNTYLIVNSGINIWSICIEDGKFKLKLKLNNNNSMEKEYNLQIKDKSLYKFEVIVTDSEIKCIISTENDVNPEIQSFNFSEYKIYDCTRDTTNNNCSSTNIIGIGKRYKFDNAPIYFGGYSDKELENTDYSFLRGYIGDFEFKLNDGRCQYTSDSDQNSSNLIKKDCVTNCLNYEGCNKLICEQKCKNVQECYFNSKKNSSRHAIDCMHKCIDSQYKCSTEYCNKQCNSCGDECYWIAQSNYLNDNEYVSKGRPYPPLIESPSISYDGTKARFKWIQSKKGIGGETKGYVALLYKTYKRDEGLRVEWIDINRCTNMCDYVISNLIPEESYTIGIKSYNASGIGMLSNLITFKTEKKVINTSILNNLKMPTNKEIGNFEICTK